MSEVYAWFRIEELEAFVKELASLRSRGVRSAICLEHAEMPEVLEAFLPGRDTASLHLVRTERGVVVCDIDDGGIETSFEALHDALPRVLRRLAV